MDVDDQGNPWPFDRGSRTEARPRPVKPEAQAHEAVSRRPVAPFPSSQRIFEHIYFTPPCGDAEKRRSGDAENPAWEGIMDDVDDQGNPWPYDLGDNT